MKIISKKVLQKINFIKYIRMLIDSGKSPAPIQKQVKIDKELDEEISNKIHKDHKYEDQYDCVDPSIQLIIKKHKNQKSPFHPW